MILGLDSGAGVDVHHMPSFDKLYYELSYGAAFVFVIIGGM